MTILFVAVGSAMLGAVVGFFIAALLAMASRQDDEAQHDTSH